MLSSTWFVVAVLASSACALPARDTLDISLIDPAVDYGNVNHFIDAILFKVNRNLPDYIELGDLGGPFDFTDCLFLGTANGIHRDGDATFLKTGNVAQFNSPFKMTDVGINCTWHYSELFMHGKCDALTQKVAISSGMGILMQRGQHPYLTEFLVSDMEPIKSHITGLTPAFNWLADDIANLILSMAEDEITAVIETQVRQAMQDILDTMIIP